jgi:hypothetical protein
VCDDQLDLCERCGGRVLVPLIGPASVRGGRWAERVVAGLVARWPPRWPRSPRALIIATRQVDDLSPASVELRRRLARVCLDAAARRYAELIDFFLRRRLLLPGADDDPSKPLDSDDTPE